MRGYLMRGQRDGEMTRTSDILVEIRWGLWDGGERNGIGQGKKVFRENLVSVQCSCFEV